jgi:predicted small lipoprotein YifL
LIDPFAFNFKTSPLMKRFSHMPAALLAIFLMLRGCQDKGAQTLPPPNVQVVAVIQKDVPVTEEQQGMD